MKLSSAALTQSSRPQSSFLLTTAAPSPELQRRQRLVLLGHVQGAAATAENRCHCGAGVLSRVAALAEMRQHYQLQPLMQHISQQLRRGPVGEMSPGSGDPGLDRRG